MPNASPQRLSLTRLLCLYMTYFFTFPPWIVCICVTSGFSCCRGSTTPEAATARVRNACAASRYAGPSLIVSKILASPSGTILFIETVGYAKRGGPPLTAHDAVSGIPLTKPSDEEEIHHLRIALLLTTCMPIVGVIACLRHFRGPNVVRRRLAYANGAWSALLIAFGILGVVFGPQPR